MKEQLRFNPEVWYQNLLKIAALPPRKRYDELVQLHQITLNDYLSQLNQITDEEAAQPSSDGRSKAIVVAHIMGWEEWQIQVFGDTNKMERLNRQMKLQGYYDDERSVYLDFENVDEFNVYQASRYADWKWENIKEKAILIAKKLQSFFPDNPLGDWIEFLENTPVRNWKLTKDKTLSIPGGWYLWMVSLKHEVVEHRKDLG